MTIYALIGLAWDDEYWLYVPVSHRLMHDRSHWWEKKAYLETMQRLHGREAEVVVAKFDIHESGVTAVNMLCIPAVVLMIDSLTERLSLMLGELKRELNYPSPTEY